MDKKECSDLGQQQQRLSDGNGLCQTTCGYTNDRNLIEYADPQGALLVCTIPFTNTSEKKKQQHQNPTANNIPSQDPGRCASGFSSSDASSSHRLWQRWRRQRPEMGKTLPAQWRRGTCRVATDHRRETSNRLWLPSVSRHRLMRVLHRKPHAVLPIMRSMLLYWQTRIVFICALVISTSFKWRQRRDWKTARDLPSGKRPSARYFQIANSLRFRGSA